MNKSFLVALREYMENLKTKAFWIGILIFPLILFLAFAVPVWLEKKKDVRYYAVIDQTDWLLEAVEKRAAFPDMEQVLKEAFELHEKGSEDFETFPEVIRGLTWVLNAAIDLQVGKEPGGEVTLADQERWKEEKKKVKREVIEQAADQLTKAAGPDGSKSLLLAAIYPKDPPEERQKKFDEEFKKPVQEWYAKLTPEEAEKFGSRLSKSRYARMDIGTPAPVPPDKVKKIEENLKRQLSEEKLFAYFVIAPNPVGLPKGQAPAETENNNKCKYVSNNLTDTDLKDWFSRYANAAVHERRISEADISEETAKWIKKPVAFESKQVSAEGEEEEVGTEDLMRQWAPVGFVYLLWISIFTITQMLLTNTIEEKSNKIMEVILSSVSPLQLMTGKIIGIAGTGLTMVVTWVIFFLACIKFLPVLLGGGPDFDLTLIVREPIYLSSFVAYFILGYLLLSAILVGIGSVCNSLKEAQNLMAPVTIIMILPLLAMVPISQDANGTIAKAMSYIPPFTPFVMMNRAAGPPSPMEYVVTSVLLVLSIAIALWAAAKIFRIGILMTGKPPKLLEILRWIRAPVGQVQIIREENE